MICIVSTSMLILISLLLMSLSGG